MEEARLQELWDHHEIRQLLATYCHGCDRTDTAMMASVYCEQSWDDHGPNKADGRAFSKLILEEARRSTRVMSHQLGQSLIRVTGDGAATETYFVATLVADTDDGPLTTQLGGRYVDALEREDGAWKIKERLCVMDWTTSGLIAPSVLESAGFIMGERGAGDVSWARLGLVAEVEPV